MADGAQSGSPGGAPVSGRAAGWLLLAALALTVLAYLNALPNPFVFDDVHLVASNRLLRSGAGLWELLTRPTLTSSHAFEGHWRPVLMLTFWLNHQVAGDAPWGYRVVNLALHLADGGLAFLLVRRVATRAGAAAEAPWAALFAASVFLLHPVQAAAIDLVLKRNSILATGFVLASMLAFLRSGDASTRGRAAAWLAASAALAALGLGSKEDAIVAPALAIACGLAAGLGVRGTLARAAALLAAPIAFLALRFPTAVVDREATPLGHLLAQPVAFARYAEMLAWPDAISAGYDLAPVADPFPWGRAAAAAALAVGAGWVLWRARRAPLAALAVAWALCWLAPSSSLVPILLTMDEIRCYPALLFAAALAALVLARLSARRAARREAGGTDRVLVAAWGAACLAMAIGTARTNHLWSNPVTLFAHAVARNPEAPVANANLCEELLRADQVAIAVPACERAARVHPGDPYTRAALVEAHARAGDLEGAAAALDEARRDLPGATPLVRSEADLAWFRGNLEGAARAYALLVERDPGDEQARVYLADALSRSGRIAEAAALVRSFDAEPPADPRHRELLEAVRGRLAGAP